MIVHGAGGRAGADACAKSGVVEKESGLKSNIIIHCYYRCLRGKKAYVEVAKLLCGTYDVHWFRAAAF